MEPHYPVEVLADLRGHVVRFIRLDFGYLAIAGTAVVAVKITSDSLFEIASVQSGILYFYFAIVAFDFYTAWLIHSDWLAARSGFGNRTSAPLIRASLYVQPAIHWFFMSLVAFGLVGYAEGVTTAKHRIQGRVLVQEKVEAYRAMHGTVPTNLVELGANGPKFAEIRRMLGGEDFRYEKLGDGAYRLTFSGWDKTFDTPDDELVTEKYLIRKVYDKLYRSDN